MSLQAPRTYSLPVFLLRAPSHVVRVPQNHREVQRWVYAAWINGSTKCACIQLRELKLSRSCMHVNLCLACVRAGIMSSGALRHDYCIDTFRQLMAVFTVLARNSKIRQRLYYFQYWKAFHHRHYQTTIIRADWYFRWAKPEPYSATSQCNHSED